MLLLLYTYDFKFPNKRSRKSLTYTSIHLPNNLFFRYKPGTVDDLLKAFRILDTENNGWFSVDYMRQVFREGGTLSEDVIDRAIKTIYNPYSESIPYHEWIPKLMVISQ